MSNVNQNRYKLTTSISNNNNNANKSTASNKYTPAASIMKSITNNNNNNIRSNLNLIKSSTALTADTNDDDLIDISDTELIMASQEVESQLKFTNNVHHATSNALNIFSQIASTNTNINNSNLMPAPTMTSMGLPVNFASNNQNNNSSHAYNSAFPGSTLASNSNQVIDQLYLLDDLKSELKQVKTENMQKDGEVKILRDKLKRLEQDTQRMRTERVDLIKKLQTQKDEEKKGLQKQIEFKELENQFKNQEIVELTMKCKQLESNNKKNPLTNQVATNMLGQQLQQQRQSVAQNYSVFDDLQSISSNSPNSTSNKSKGIEFSKGMPPPQSSICTPQSQQTANINNNKIQNQTSNQQIIGSKGVPTKRMICQTSISSLSGLNDSENENPTHDNKR